MQNILRMGTSIKNQWMAFLAAALVTIFGIFPQALADRIKSGLNVANTRTAQYKEIATAYSTLTFSVDGICQVYTEGIQLGVINVGFARGIVKQYNDALTQLMNNQYVYKDEVRKLWGTKYFFVHTDVPEKYDSLWRYVNELDPAVHAINWMGIILQPLADNINYKLSVQEIDSLRKPLVVLQNKVGHLHSLTEQVIEGME